MTGADLSGGRTRARMPQAVLYETIQNILQVLKAVTAELHAQHPGEKKEVGRESCNRESCRTLSQLEAQVDALRRSLGIASFRTGGF